MRASGGGGARSRRRSWTAGLGFVILGALLAGALTRGLWLPWIARGLVCEETSASGDAIVVENFDPSYLVFERAAALQRTGSAMRVLVPVASSKEDGAVANPVSRGIAELMARFARLDSPEIVPIREAEPYALNAALQIRDALGGKNVHSVVVVAPAFRSRRSALVYDAVLGPAGIRVSCVPVYEGHTPEDWTTSWHGIEVVTEQFLKLQFYRVHVLRAWAGGRS